MSDTSFDSDFAMALLGKQTIDIATYKSTSQKDYAPLLRHFNVTSFSQQGALHACPRKFFKMKERAFLYGNSSDSLNVDFAFGHAVGAGVQHYIKTRNEDYSLLHAMLAWRAEFEAAIPKRRKNLWGALYAVRKFILDKAPSFFEEWEILVLPNGKAAIELSFSFHCGNGFKHYGHLDIVLRNRRTGMLMVVDCKTLGLDQAEPALYSNSTQALSYAVMLNTVMPGIVDYDVMYLVYCTTSREWVEIPCSKTALDQAEWIKDILLDQDMIKTYHELRFFPKRGESCFDYFRRCEFYGECDKIEVDKLPALPDAEEAEQTDYTIDLSAVIESQRRSK